MRISDWSSDVCSSDLLVIRARHLAVAVLMPIYLLIALVLLSGGANGDMAGAIGVAVKYAYVIVVLIAAFEALRQDSKEEVMSLLIWSFAPLLLFQWLSLGLNLPKGSETGDGLVWIGGYNHEAAFSVALSTGFVIACLAYKMHPLLRFGFLGITLIGIFLAGYRTAIFAMGPLALATFWVALTQYVKPEQRRAVAAVALVIVLTGAAAVVVAYHSRFADVATFLSDPGSLIKPPRAFTQLAREIMSGTPRLWSEYPYDYDQG